MPHTTVTIKRSEWACGSPSQLLDSCGMKCCLGFFESQIVGRPDVEIAGIGDPNYLQWRKDDPLQQSLRTFVLDAMTVNDNPYTTAARRERWLIKLFRDAGYELEFVGEYTAEQLAEFPPADSPEVGYILRNVLEGEAVGKLH